jgi:hypothetical protein
MNRMKRGLSCLKTVTSSGTNTGSAPTPQISGRTGAVAAPKTGHAGNKTTFFGTALIATDGWVWLLYAGLR